MAPDMSTGSLSRQSLLFYLFAISAKGIQMEAFPMSAFYALASPGEGHTRTCLRYQGMSLPNTYTDYPNWNITSLATIAGYFNLSVSKSAPNGIKGCCAPGMWCDHTGCFTQSFEGPFANIGWLNDNNQSVPVYSCYFASSTKAPQIMTTSYKFGSLQLSGVNFLEDNDAITAEIGTESCNHLQLCNSHQCRPCVKDSCPQDSVCIVDGKSSSCYMFCGGAIDASCPCSSFCDSVTVYSSTYNTATSLSLCTYQSFITDTGGTCLSSSIAQADTLLCRSPRASKKSAVAATSSVSLSVIGGATIIPALKKYGLPPAAWCTLNSDCFDGNICTADTCVSGYCSYSSVLGCDSVLQTVRERVAPYTYNSYYQRSKYTQQAAFEQEIQLRGIAISLNSNPQIAILSVTLPFSFSLFGTTVRSFTVMTTGVINFPPVGHCTGSTFIASVSLVFLCSILQMNMRCARTTRHITIYFNYGNYGVPVWEITLPLTLLPSLLPSLPPYCISQCITFSTFSNTIAPLASAYGFTAGQSQVLMLSQSAGDGSLVYGIDATGYHVLFQKFRNASATSGVGSTFSVTLYIDGSIRMRYHTVDLKTLDPIFDYAGIWGSRMSKLSTSYLRYHQENISIAIVAAGGGGTDVVFCSLPNVVACAIEACVAPSKPLVLRWGSGLPPSCSAASSVNPPVVRCVWAGLVETELTYFIPSLAQRILAGNGNYTHLVLCPVPVLDIADGSVISVAITVRAYSAELIPIKSAPGTHSTYSVSMGKGGELARTPVMVRYYSSMSAAQTKRSCGCSALTAYANQVCDSSAVCGGLGVAGGTTDCSGEPFGNAYVDSCGVCAGGLTKKTPSQSCNPTSGTATVISSNAQAEALTLVYQIAIAISVICCISCVLSVIFYFVKWALMGRTLLATANAFVGAAVGPSTELGLTPLELEQLGEYVYGFAVYNLVSRDCSLGLKNPIRRREQPCPPVECSICLMDINVEDKCRVLPQCLHLFHSVCVDAWFRCSVSCPLCKRSMRAILNPSTDSTASAAADSAPMEVTHAANPASLADTNGSFSSDAGSSAFLDVSTQGPMARTSSVEEVGEASPTNLRSQRWMSGNVDSSSMLDLSAACLDEGLAGQSNCRNNSEWASINSAFRPPYILVESRSGFSPRIPLGGMIHDAVEGVAQHRLGTHSSRSIYTGNHVEVAYGTQSEPTQPLDVSELLYSSRRTNSLSER